MNHEVGRWWAKAANKDMSKQKQYSVWERATLVFMVATCCVQPAFGGTQGSYMNSRGYGKAVDVISYDKASAVAESLNRLYPCARVNPAEAPPFPSGFQCSDTGDNIEILLPKGCPEKVYCQSVGRENYVWYVQAYVTGGATADNPKLEAKANIQADNCFSQISVQTGYKLINDQIGQISVEGFATAGAALGLTGYHYMPPEGGSSEPQSAEDLENYGVLQFEYVLPGPFSFGTGEECTVLNIPIVVPDPENFYFKVDTAALSIPFEIACPAEVVVRCGEPLVYPTPEVISGGCGDPAKFAVSYDPPLENLPPGDSAVTVTVTDENGNQAQCIFKVSGQSCLGVFPGNDSISSVAELLGVPSSSIAEIAYVNGSTGSNRGLEVFGVSGPVGSEVLRWGWNGAAGDDLYAVAFKFGTQYIVCTKGGAPFSNGNYEVDLRCFSPGFAVNSRNKIAGLSHARAYGWPR
jgi:hypothetical protein